MRRLPWLSSVVAAVGDHRSLFGWTCTLWAIALMSEFIAVAIFAATGDNTSVLYGMGFLVGESGSDSWYPMVRAIEHLRATPDVPVYAELFPGRHLRFQYPISSLLIPDLLQRVTGASWTTIAAILNALSWFCVWAIAVVCWRLLLGSHRLKTDTRGGSRAELWLLLPCLALTVLFVPLTQSFVLGQVQTAMTLFAALALLLWRTGRKVLAGVLFGICCAIKPQWAVLLVWGALRAEWTMVAAGTAAFGTLALTAGALYGFGNYVDYIPVLSVLSRHGEAFFANQSVNGLMNRLLFNGNSLEWAADVFPDFHPAVYAATLSAAVLILGSALLFRRRAQPGPLDVGLIVLSATMAAPIAWDHHYAVLLPIFAAAAPIALAVEPFRRRTGAVLLLAYLLASQRLDLANRVADTPLNIVQSYLFFGAAIVLVLLYRTAGRVPEASSFAKEHETRVPVTAAP